MCALEVSVLALPNFINFFQKTVDKERKMVYNNQAVEEKMANFIFFGVWLSLVECLVRVQEAGGSNPLTPTKNSQIA